MPSVRDRFFQMLSQGVEVGSKGAINGADNRLKQLLQTQAEKATMDKLGAEHGQKDKEYQRSLTDAEALRAKYGPDASVDTGPVKIGGRPAALFAPPKLTPAQEAAEKKAGAQIADYNAAGGRGAMEKTVGALDTVAADLVPQKDAAGNVVGPAKRDNYDRYVGGTLGDWPTLQGLFAPTEKRRRDAAWSTAHGLAKQNDPNPTEKQIKEIMGTVYDPASRNEDNAVRIARLQEEQKQKADQMEQASQNYRNTGYVTLGGPGIPSPAPIEPQGGPEDDEGDFGDLYPENKRPQVDAAAAAKKMRLEQLRAKKAGRKQ